MVSVSNIPARQTLRKEAEKASSGLFLISRERKGGLEKDVNVRKHKNVNFT